MNQNTLTLKDVNKYYTISKFETILKKYVQKSNFNNELKYMCLMIKSVSKGLKPIYRDLNGILTKRGDN